MQFPEIEDFVKARRSNNGVHSTIIGRRILANPGVTTTSIEAVDYADIWLRGITVSAKPYNSQPINSVPLLAVVNKRTSRSLWSNISSINGLNDYPDYLPIDAFSPGVLIEHENFFCKKIVEISELIQRNQLIEISVLNQNTVPCTVAIAFKSYFIYEE